MCSKCWGVTGWEVGLEGGKDGQEVMGNLRRDSVLVHGVTSRVSPDMWLLSFVTPYFPLQDE